MDKPSIEKPAVDKSVGATGVTGSNHVETSTNLPQPGTADLSGIFSPAEAPGEIGRFGHYRVLKILGQGGMGVVLLAEDTNLRRETALKLMLPQYAKNTQARARFIREARAAARVKHDHIVHINRVGEEGGVPFIEMELLVGQSLEEYLKNPGSLPIDQVLRIGRQIAEGLAAAHAHGLIHRDIKPANIWLDANTGRVKILDFGLARDSSDEAHLTQSGAVIGTASYMAPEQALGEPTDARSDLFSLGVVLYRLATGKLPFSGKTFGSIMVALTTQQEVPARQLNPLISTDLGRLIERLMAKNPDDRPQTTREVLSDLAALEGTAPPKSDWKVPMLADDGEPIVLQSAQEVTKSAPKQSWHPSAKKPRRKPMVAGLLGLTLALLGAGVYFFTRTPEPKPNAPFVEVARNHEPAIEPIVEFFPIEEDPESMPIPGSVEMPQQPPEASPVETPAVVDPPKPIPVGPLPKVDDGNSTGKPPKGGAKPKLTWAGEDEFHTGQILAYGSKVDMVEAIEWYRKSAAKGHPLSMFTLAAYLIHGGYGVYDPTEGYKLIRAALPEMQRAAENNLSFAQSRLGEFHRDGYGGKVDYAEAMQWSRKAAEQECPYAQVDLGQMYERGREGKPDFEEAMKWYRRSAQQEYVGAYYAIGHLYDTGKGVEKNETEAMKWYRKAAAQNYAPAENSIGIMYQTGIGVGKNETEAMKWYLRAAKQNYAAAQNSIGILYQMGRGIEKNDAEAVKWYRKAADQNHPSAQTNLGHMYENGTGVDRDAKEAIQWYSKAANQNYASAMYCIGNMYLVGKGIEKSEAEAFKWYRGAAERNFVSAQVIVGSMYAEGRGVARDFPEAAKWFHKAADQNNSVAQANLAKMYELGLGVTRNSTDAIALYRQAAKAGNKNAKDALLRLGFKEQ